MISKSRIKSKISPFYHGRDDSCVLLPLKLHYTFQTIEKVPHLIHKFLIQFENILDYTFDEYSNSLKEIVQQIAGDLEK